MKKKIFIIVLFLLYKAEAQTSAFKIIDSLSARGQYKKALRLLEKKRPQTFTSFRKSADIYYSIDDFKNAVYYYNYALKIKEDYKVQLQLANSYRKIKQYQKTIEIYKDIVGKDADNLFVTYQLGKLYLVTDQLKKAYLIFNKLTKEDVDNANYWYQLATIFGKIGDGNKMIDAYLKSYKSDTTHLKSIYKLASVYKKMRKKDSSNLFVEKGLNLDKNHINLNKLKINDLYIDKDYEESIVLLKHLDTINQNELYTQKMLGKSYFYLKDYDNAKLYLQKAKIIDREDFKIYTFLGHVEKALKNYPRAQSNYFLATMKGKKKRHLEYYSLGLLFLETKEPKIAIRMFKKALEENRYHYLSKYQLAITTDATFKDKKIAYKLYDDYVLRFEEKDKKMTAFAKSRLKELTKQLFLKGEKID